jgi:hypothetical protein
MSLIRDIGKKAVMVTASDNGHRIIGLQAVDSVIILAGTLGR